VGLILAEMQSRVKDLMKDQQNAVEAGSGWDTGHKTLDACRLTASTALTKVSPEEGCI